jgi:hypothetical protein
MNHSVDPSIRPEQESTWHLYLAYGLVVATAAAAEFLPSSPIAHEVGHQFGHALRGCQRPAETEANPSSPFDSLIVPSQR